MSEILMGVVPNNEDPHVRNRAFWIMCESGGYPVKRGYECSRCESCSDVVLPECPVCGAEMSNMVIQSMWVDFADGPEE